MYQPGHPRYDSIVLWEWDLDNDGVFGAPGEIVFTSWPEDGTYFVSLRVTDGTDRSDEKGTTVIVGSPHDVATDNLDLSRSFGIPTGEVIPVNVTVSNVGDYVESFDVTLYCDDDVIAIIPVIDLAQGTYIDVSSSWDTSGKSEGAHTIKACAEVVPGEINAANNCVETMAEVFDQRTLTISSGEGGSVTEPGEGRFPYDFNSVVALVARPDICFEFTGWTGTAVDKGNVTEPDEAETEVLVDGDYTLFAEFALENLPIIPPSQGGYVVVDKMIDWYECEKWIFVEAIAEPCYEFSHWTGSVLDELKVTDATLSAIDFVADMKYTLKAHFEPTMIEDDFESYNHIDPNEPGSNRIFEAWADGFGDDTNGAVVGYDPPEPSYTETTIVHGGSQSMPYSYSYDSNTVICEATKTIDCPRDWTEAGAGVTTLSLWFQGDPTNAAEPMFVALNGSAVVYHDDPAATQIADWTEWTINLQTFADRGVDLTNVNKITIGFGTKNAPTAGGTGKVYFDDIRLLQPAEQPQP